MGTKQVFAIVLLTLLVIWAIFAFSYSYYVDYQYENQIGSYFSNAIDMNTPDKILQQIQLGKQAIIEADLPSHGAMFFPKPSNSMEFQLSHIDSIIERIQAVQDWKDKSYGKDGQAEAMGDVYEQKMTNLRKFIKEDLDGTASRSDWIAEDAWYVKTHPIIYLWVIWLIIWIILLLISLALLFSDDY